MAMWLLILPVALADICPQYMCNDQTVTNGTCVSYMDNIFTITACDSDHECLTDFSQTDKECQELQLGNRYPGEFCADNDECVSANCSENVCQGGKLNSKCENVYDCNPGFYCDTDSLNCSAQTALGKSCSSDYECINTAVCSSGNCVTYFSLALGTQTDVFTGIGFSWACASGFASENEEGEYVCSEPPKSSADLPVKCQPGDECSSSDVKYSLNCVCGLNKEGQGYCPLFPGDDPVQNMISSIKNILNFNLGCNTYQRFSYKCFATQDDKVVDDLYDFLVYYYQSAEGMYPYIQDNPTCVSQTYTREISEIQYAQQNFSSNKCPKYICSSTDFATDQCIIYEKDLYNYLREEKLSIRPCEEDSSCPTSRLSDSYCEKPHPTRYPGDFCTHSDNCTTESCDKNTCGDGREENEACSNIYDCSPGFYCDGLSLTCQQQKALGEECEISYECENLMTCNVGECLYMYSLDLKKITDQVKGYGYAEACKTGFAEKKENGSFECATAPISKSKDLIECSPGDLCESADGKHYKPCICGYNEDGKAYCPSFEGDSYLQTAIENYSKLRSMKNSCNTFSRNTAACYATKSSMTVVDAFYSYATNFTMYQNLPYLQDNSDCIKQVFTRDFWQLEADWEKEEDDDDKDDNEDFGRHLIVTLALFLGLFI